MYDTDVYGCAGKTVRSLKTRAIPECLRGVITTRDYTNLRLPLPLPESHGSGMVKYRLC